MTDEACVRDLPREAEQVAIITGATDVWSSTPAGRFGEPAGLMRCRLNGGR